MFQAIRYFFEEGISSLLKNKGINIISIGTIVISLYVLGIFIFISSNLTAISERWRENIQVNIFLESSVNNEQLELIQKRLAHSPQVEEMVYISPKEALERFKSFFTGLKTLPEELGENPFPASIELKIRQSYQNPDAIKNFVSLIERLPGVDDIQFDLQWIERLTAIIKIIRIIGIFLTAVLIFASISTSSNVIRLLIYARRDEIEIMRLVGASNSYIKGPFVIEGMVQGLLSGLFAIAFLWLSYRFGLSYFTSSHVSLLNFITMPFLSLNYCLTLVFGGLFMGLLASFFSMGRFLRI
jgi:cell division transport system permease protein